METPLFIWILILPILVGVLYLLSRKFAIHNRILLGLILGVGWAFFSSTFGLKQFTLDWINPWGNIFMNLLKLIAVPLILFSIIKGVYDLSDISKFGKLGLKTIGIFLITTTTSVTIGILFGNIFSPGKSVDQELRVLNRIKYEIWAEQNNKPTIDGNHIKDDPQYAHLVANAQEIASKEAQSSMGDKIDAAQKKKESGPLSFIEDMVPKNIFYSLTVDKLILQIIFFAIFFGLTLLYLDKTQVKPAVNFIFAMNEVFLKMIDLVMSLAPYFVFCLMAGKLTELAGDSISNMLIVFKSLGIYSLVVFGGLCMMMFFTYPTLLKVFTKRSVLKFFKAASPAQMLAFSTSSSAATLPITMECVNDRMGISKDTSSFVLPVGATINMDGTSLYQAVAVLFLAQFHMIDLTLTQQLTVILTAILASVGTAAVPSAGIIMLILVLESVGLNPAWIAIILPVDRILDMCRTAVNVTGDMTVCNIIANDQKDD